MDNNELLSQVLSAMQEQTELLTKMMDQKIQASEERTDRKFAKLETLIENNVSKKIEALFDGYQLTHEKQWEMDRKLRQLEQRIERLEEQAG